MRRRHDAQDALAGVRRRVRRVGADALPGPGHDVRVIAGGLRHGLPVLRHRPGRADQEPVGGRDRDAGVRRSQGDGDAARCPAARAGSRTSSSWAWASRWRTTPSVLAAVRRITEPAPAGLGISQRAVTVSTVGLVPAIRRLAAEGLSVRLAVSLHAPDDELRDELVPVNRRWKVAEVLDAAWDYAACDRAPGVDRVRDDPRHQRPRLAG